MPRKRVVHVVDDEAAVRASTEFLLSAAEYDVTSWSSGVTFLESARHLRAGCVLLDIRMADMDGLEVQEELRRQGMGFPVIILTGHADVQIAVRAMKAGAIEFLEKPLQREALLGAIEHALAELDDNESRRARGLQAERLLATLSNREKEVLSGLTRGMPNKRIAYGLGISPRTVEIHRANLMAKLGARNLSDTLRIAFSGGLGAELI
jgi:two-component system, LuxR family, response regulator FixJ